MVFPGFCDKSAETGTVSDLWDMGKRCEYTVSSDECETVVESAEKDPGRIFLSNVLMTVIYEKHHLHVEYIPITFRPRQAGKNSINMKRIIKSADRHLEILSAFATESDTGGRTMKIQIRKILPESIAAVILIALSAYLLGGDVWTFWTWWLLALFMGMVAMPVTGRLFEGFEDKGWLFSKALAIAVTGFLTWFLVAVKLLPFTAATCIGVSVICGIFCAILFHVQLKKGIECYPSGKSS